MKHLFLTFLIVSATVIVSSGQKTLKEWSEQDDSKFTKKWVYLNTLQHLKTSVKKGWLEKDQIPEINEIGMLSFTLFQPTFTSVKGVTVKNIYTPFYTPEGLEWAINGLAKQVVPGIAEGAKSKGVRLLIPEDYLTSDVKQKIYDEYEWEPSKLMGATAEIASFVRSPQTKIDPKVSYGKLVMMADSDIKTWRDIGKLAGDFDVDLLAVVEQTIFLDGKKGFSNLGPIKITLIGSNPTPLTDKVSYAPVGPLKGYLEGFIYGSVTVNPPGEYKVAFYETTKIDGEKRDKMTYDDISPLSKIYARITTHLIDYVNSELNDIKN